MTGHFTSYEHRTDHELATSHDFRHCLDEGNAKIASA